MSVLAVLVHSALKGAGELLINVGTSGVLEALFPPFRLIEDGESRVSYELRNLVEATLEVGAYLLVSGTISSAWGDVFGAYELARLPYGALLMFWLLENAMLKLKSFVGFINYRMRHRYVRDSAASSDDAPSGDSGVHRYSECRKVIDQAGVPGLDGAPGKNEEYHYECE